ncbi:MAG: PKD domain-containing protein [Patescibacteria group bacterium]|jgi:hypothetical protein
MFKKLAILLVIACLFLPTVVAAAFKYDLGVHHEDIRIVGGQLIAGKTMNAVARIHNYGSEDAKGYCSFYLGEALLSDSQVISILSGTYDDVWVELPVPKAAFNIRVVINIQGQTDERPENNQDQTGMLYPDIDTDGDGSGNQQDTDDDNDGLIDTEETRIGTNPLLADTDGDGRPDGQDAFPLDPARWQVVVVPPPVVKPVVAPVVPVVAKTPAATVAASESAPKPAEPAPLAEDNLLSKIKPTVLGLETGEKVNIIYQPLGWGKYKFQADLPAAATGEASYFWDFGDGGQSADSLAVHHFWHAGHFQVKLKVIDQAGAVKTGDLNLSISWFNPGNYQLWLIVFLLCAIIFGLLFSLRLGHLSRPVEVLPAEPDKLDDFNKLINKKSYVRRKK